MTLAKPISVIQSPDLLSQQTATLSRLSKRELDEIHATPTNYPSLNNVNEHQGLSKPASFNLFERSIDKTAKNSLGKMREDSKELNLERGGKVEANNAVSISKRTNSLTSGNSIKSQKEDDALDDVKECEIDKDLHHFRRGSSLGAAATGGLSEPKSLVQRDSSAECLNSNLSLTAAANLVASSTNDELFATSQPCSEDDLEIDLKNDISLDEKQVAPENLRNLEVQEKESDPNIGGDPFLQKASQGNVDEELKKISENDISVDEKQVATKNLRNLEVQEKGSDPNIGGDPLLQKASQGNADEELKKISEKGSGENSGTMSKPLMTRPELTPVTGSTGSSPADHSNLAATAALRVTHLLDELTATVSRLRSSDNGKEMTIQLRRDVLDDTSIHIVSSAKQMEVSFLTGNAMSNLLLNTHLTTLQNHLNVICPGQVVTVQTQLTSSSGSSHLGSEQDHSQDDLASFDQGNRGDFRNNEET